VWTPHLSKKAPLDGETRDGSAPGRLGFAMLFAPQTIARRGGKECPGWPTIYFGAWNLVLVWNLGFGICDLDFPGRHPRVVAQAGKPVPPSCSVVGGPSPRCRKSQAPNHKQAPRTKSKEPNRQRRPRLSAVFGIWVLEFGSCLELGICDLVLTVADPRAETARLQHRGLLSAVARRSLRAPR